MPAGVAVEIEALGEQVVRRRLLRFEENVQNAIPAFVKIIALIEAAELEQFATEGGSGSGGWAPLSPSTLAAKARKGQDPAILQATHRLLNSLVEGGVSSGGDRIRQVGPLEMRYGTNVPYAIYHQTGTRKMPQRKVIELTEGEKVAIAKIVQAHILGERSMSAAGVRVVG